MLDAYPHLDLLFSHVVLPGGMSGVELGQEAQRRRPGLKVLLTSGDTETTIKQQEAPRMDFEMIEKPYKMALLAKRVGEILQRQEN